MSSSGRHLESSTWMAIMLMCLNVVQGNVGAKMGRMFINSWTPEMQNPQVACIGMQKSVGGMQLLMQQTVHKTWSVHDRSWQRQSCAMSRLQLSSSISGSISQSPTLSTGVHRTFGGRLVDNDRTS